MWMNRYDIEEAVIRFHSDPVLGPAARFLRSFQEQVDEHSDGWPYWMAPSRAASKLMALLYVHLRVDSITYPTPARPTEADVRRALVPIKAFMTRKGRQAGMTMPPIPF